MTMYHVKRICLSCKHYRLADEISGVCRVDKKTSDHYPLKANEDSCERWHDCGQQYFIRQGWIKAQKSKDLPRKTN